MYLDTSLDRFDPAKHYSAVLLQQGRVILDSDVAEQAAIWAHQARTALTDLIGPYGAPSGNSGFQVSWAATGSRTDLAISPGRAYVDGILAEVEGPAVTYLNQPDGYVDPDLDKLPPDAAYVVYLRVWERSVTAVQDPDIREVALGIHGPDTAGRARVVWQVAAWPVKADSPAEALKLWRGDFLTSVRLARAYQPVGPLQAQAVPPGDAELDICSVSPQAQYRGRENQHYRVEIFGSGVAAPAAGQSGIQGSQATYVWSRDNGSVVFAVDSLAGAEVTVASLGRDIPARLEIGDWVEIVDDASASHIADDVPAAARARAVFQVMAIDPLGLVVTLDRDPSRVIGTTGTDPARHPLLRRWDGVGAGDTAGAGIPLAEGSWLPLEDGVQVRFPGIADSEGGPARYRDGDYWLIPARTVLGDVIWPQEPPGPKARPPAGVAYHYAPLAFIPAGGDPQQLLPVFSPLAHSPV
jgi:hypothetical protein